MWDSFNWDKLDEALLLPPPNILLLDFQDLGLDFIKENMKEATREMGIFELAQVTFYAMMSACANEVRVLLETLNNILEDALEGLN